MKNKKETILKIILGILTFILIFYISFSLLFLSTFNISKKFITKGNITSLISNINIIDVIKKELGNEIKEFSIMEDDLLNLGISNDGIDNFVNSKDVKEFSGNVITNIFDRISDKNIDYKISQEEVSNLFENNIDKLNINSSISNNELLNKIEDKIPNLVLNINDIIDKLCVKLENSEIFQKYESYIYSSVNIFDYIYSNFVLGIIIFIIVTFICLLMFIRKSIYKSLKWIGLAFIIPSIILGIMGVIISKFVQTNNAITDGIVTLISKELIYNFRIYLIIFLIIILINIIWYMIKKYKVKKVIPVE